MKAIVVDDHSMVREGLRLVLEKRGVEVIGEAPGGRDAVELVRRLRPDVVVMDVKMRDLNGIEATRQITRELSGVKVIALSMHDERRYVAAMFAAGASAYILKDSASSELVRAIEAVAKNERYVTPSLGTVSDLPPPSSEPRRSELSDREREVLQLLAEGFTSKEIAARLGIALPTVETYRRQIMTKLRIRTIAELTKFAIREGLTPLDD
jgi:DNA-binding NarL/FixJ family response regulator